MRVSPAVDRTVSSRISNRSASRIPNHALALTLRGCRCSVSLPNWTAKALLSALSSFIGRQRSGTVADGTDHLSPTAPWQTRIAGERPRSTPRIAAAVRLTPKLSASCSNDAKLGFSRSARSGSNRYDGIRSSAAKRLATLSTWDLPLSDPMSVERQKRNCPR